MILYGSNKIVSEINDFCNVIQEITDCSHYLELEKKDFDNGRINRYIFGKFTFDELYENEIKELGNSHEKFIKLFCRMNDEIKRKIG